MVTYEGKIEIGSTPLLRRALEGLMALLTVGGRYRLGLELLQSAAGALGVEPGDGADPAVVAALRRSESSLLDQLGRHVEAIDRAVQAVHAARRAGQPRLLVLSLLALAWSRKTVDGDSAQYAVTRQALLAAGCRSTMTC